MNQFTLVYTVQIQMNSDGIGVRVPYINLMFFFFKYLSNEYYNENVFV